MNLLEEAEHNALTLFAFKEPQGPLFQMEFNTMRCKKNCFGLRVSGRSGVIPMVTTHADFMIPV